MTKRLATMLAGPLMLYLALSFTTGVTRALERGNRIEAGAAPTENVLEPIQIPHERTTGIRPPIIASGPKLAWKELQQDEVEAATGPGAVGIGPLAVANDGVHAPTTPEIARPITLLTLGAPSPGVRKLLDFIKGEGQQYIAY